MVSDEKAVVNCSEALIGELLLLLFRDSGFKQFDYDVSQHGCL